MRSLTAKISKELYDYRKTLAKKNNVTMTDIDRQLVRLGKKFNGKLINIKEIKF